MQKPYNVDGLTEFYEYELNKLSKIGIIIKKKKTNLNID